MPSKVNYIVYSTFFKYILLFTVVLLRDNELKRNVNETVGAKGEREIGKLFTFAILKFAFKLTQLSIFSQIIFSHITFLLWLFVIQETYTIKQFFCLNSHFMISVDQIDLPELANIVR